MTTSKENEKSERLEGTSGNRPIWKKLLRWTVQIIVLGAIAFFLTRAVVTNWQQIKSFQWQSINVWILLASFACLLVTQFYMIFLWRWNLVKLGAQINLSSAFRIFSLSYMGRYLPGKVWQMVGMVYLGHKEGVRAEAGVWAAILVEILAIISGILVTLVALLLEQKRLLSPLFTSLKMGAISPWWLLLPLAISLILIHPKILESCTNWLLRLFKRQPIKFGLSYSGVLGFFLLYILSWLMYGAAFYLFLLSVSPLPLSDISFVTGSFTASYVVGLLAIFVPGGLGVREGLLSLFLSGLMGSGVAVALSFAQRLWFTLAELTFVVISLIFLRRKNVKEKRSKED